MTDAVRGALLRLANAADAVGVAHFDDDDLSPEVEEMQRATGAARAALSEQPAHPSPAEQPGPILRTTMTTLLTRTERYVIREALSQLLDGENNLTEAQSLAGERALAKMTKADPARSLRSCLALAYSAFSRDDDGWAESLIVKTRRILKETEEQP